MKRIIGFIGLFLLAFAGIASANGFGDIWAGIKDQALTYIIGAAVAIAAGLGGKVFVKINRSLTETGQFFIALGEMTADPKVTREELAAVLKEGAEVISLWKPTPAKYQTGGASADPNAPPLVKP